MSISFGSNAQSSLEVLCRLLSLETNKLSLSFCFDQRLLNYIVFPFVEQIDILLLLSQSFDVVSLVNQTIINPDKKAKKTGITKEE